MNLSQLVNTIQSLKEQFKTIKSIEYSKVSDFYWFNIVEVKDDSLITDRTYTGFDEKLDVAFSKAVSEFVERKSFNMGYSQNLKSCLTERSDGFAAYPLIQNDIAKAKKISRENALAEAIERYAWASWWDNNFYEHEHEEYTLSDFAKKYSVQSKILNEIDQEKKIQKIHIVEPLLENYQDLTLKIIVVEFSDGIVTGGACGLNEDDASIITRAISELLRHALVLIQNKKRPDQLSLYEDRLLYFATPDGTKSFYKRINQKGIQKIKLPNLAIDELIPSVQSHVVHRCLFENQPPFIGGAVERMCL